MLAVKAEGLLLLSLHISASDKVFVLVLFPSNERLCGASSCRGRCCSSVAQGLVLLRRCSAAACSASLVLSWLLRLDVSSRTVRRSLSTFHPCAGSCYRYLISNRACSGVMVGRDRQYHLPVSLAICCHGCPGSCGRGAEVIVWDRPQRCSVTTLCPVAVLCIDRGFETPPTHLAEFGCSSPDLSLLCVFHCVFCPNTQQ